MLPGSFPIFRQFLDVSLTPLQDMCEGTPRTAPQDRPVMDSDGRLVVTVGRVEVRRIVILVEHTDHDPQEAADLGYRAYSTRTL